VVKPKAKEQAAGAPALGIFLVREWVVGHVRGPDNSIAPLWRARTVTATGRGGISPFWTATFRNLGGSSMCFCQKWGCNSQL
jgi:hypothetical protein